MGMVSTWIEVGARSDDADLPLCYQCCAKTLVAMPFALDPARKDQSPYHPRAGNFFENALNGIAAAMEENGISIK